jgi:hypothetical protein
VKGGDIVNSTNLGVIGITLIALGAIGAAVVITLIGKDQMAITAAKDYVLVAATAVGTIGGFLTGYATGKSVSTPPIKEEQNVLPTG